MGEGVGLISGNSSNIQEYFVLDNKTILWVLVQTELSQAEYPTPHMVLEPRRYNSKVQSQENPLLVVVS